MANITIDNNNNNSRKKTAQQQLHNTNEEEAKRWWIRRLWASFNTSPHRVFVVLRDITNIVIPPLFLRRLKYHAIR